MSDPGAPTGGRGALAGRRARLRRVLGDPIAAGVVTAAIGLLALALGQPLLFPSLGPTAVVQIEYPEHITARFYNTVIGHVAGAAAAFACVILAGADRLPPATVEVTLPRVVAASVALALTIAATRLLRASHPPAASTTLLVALGGFPVTVGSAAAILAGVLLVGVIGGGIRALRARYSPLAPDSGGEASDGRRPDRWSGVG